MTDPSNWSHDIVQKEIDNLTDHMSLNKKEIGNPTDHMSLDKKEIDNIIDHVIEKS